jgi:menaquinone-dependent protoporphyrinogen oxidase
MHVLVAYATKHGATQGIAERIAETLRAEGFEAEARPAGSVRDLSGYDAFVVGSAAYMYHWMKDAANLLRRNGAILRRKPVWLFSSGPIGTERTNKQGVDQKVASVPKEMPELRGLVDARDHHVFYGMWIRDRPPIGLAERFMTLMPKNIEGMPEGDFRDWPEIEAWSREIARELTAVPAATG